MSEGQPSVWKCCWCSCGDEPQIPSAGLSENTPLLAPSSTGSSPGRVSGDGCDNVSKTSSTTEKTPSTHSRSPQPDIPKSTSPSSKDDPESRGARFSFSVEARNEDRMEQEKEEHAKMAELIRKINAEERYSIEGMGQSLAVGGRLQKYWYLASAQGTEERVLLTVAPLSKRCAIEMSKLTALNGFLSKIGKHPLLQPIREIMYREGNVLIFQPLMKSGSLRDYLHKVKKPMKDWADKYAVIGKRKMTREEIAVCAKSVMEAVQFLYDHGFPAMGHIQTGNIFKTPDGYKLGGYENTLLGYKSRYHHLCLEYGNDSDIIMLGHVIYEMASEGRELTDTIPSKDSDDYQHVKDEAVKAVLKHIFTMVSEPSSVPRDNLKELLHHEFFIVPEGKIRVGYDCQLSRQEKALMKQVRQGREKHQKEKKGLSEKGKSVRAMNLYMEKKKLRKVTVDDLMSIGTRAGKFWGKVEDMRMLVSAAEVSSDCPIKLTSGSMKTIREFCRRCQHPNLLILDDLKFYKKHVILVEGFQEQGSLRDLIYRTTPWSKWSEKKRVTGTALPKNQIQVYATQILMACKYLYQLGFPQLGQIQSGNIFIEGDNLRLGGFENTLFGYRAVGSEKFQQYYGHLDRMMFGHVVYEMGAGTIVETAVPTDADYRKISNKLVRSFVKNVFDGVHETIVDPSVGSSVDSRSGAGRLTPDNMGWIKQPILSHDFLRGSAVEEDANVPEDVADILKNILKEVRKDRPMKQRSISQFGASVVRSFRQKSQRIRHESSSEPTRTQT